MPWYIIGQCFGAVAIALGFVSYQMRTQKQILFVQSATAVAFCIHYLLIGAFSGLALNAFNIIRNFIYHYRNEHKKNGLLAPIICTAISCSIGILTWILSSDGWYTIFIVIGVGVNTFCMSFKDPQKVRTSVIITSPFVFAYDVFVLSIGGMIYESVAWVSAGIGFFRNFKKKDGASKLPEGQ